jgi:hypothetical protein
VSYLDKTNGRCYELSADEVLNGTLFGIDPDITLVHGTVYHPAHPVYDHAWVVSGDGTVHDLVLGVSWPSREAHKEATGLGGQAKYLTTYTRMEAINNMACVYRHAGPWNADNPPLIEDDDDDYDDYDGEWSDAYGRSWGKCNECQDDDVLIVRGVCHYCDTGEWATRRTQRR